MPYILIAVCQIPFCVQLMLESISEIMSECNFWFSPQIGSKWFNLVQLGQFVLPGMAEIGSINISVFCLAVALCWSLCRVLVTAG